MTDSNADLWARLDHLVDRLEAIFGPAVSPQLETDVLAYRWRAGSSGSALEPITQVHNIAVEDLVAIERQISVVDANTRQFLADLPCNNVLMWGARGTGKSSLVKAMLNRYGSRGLRVVEIDAHDLPHVVQPLVGREERFILFVDDLSFDADDASYRTLKAALDGSVAVAPDNVIIYATSNRRHLLPEHMVDNEHSRLVEGELHHGEAVEEKISLSERFGVWLAFHPFNQEQYLSAVVHWLSKHGFTNMDEECRKEALKWALTRGNRSGRIAAQFAQDYAGKQALDRS
jgi:predicted AAA+ superfamily ATPase